MTSNWLRRIPWKGVVGGLLAAGGALLWWGGLRSVGGSLVLPAVSPTPALVPPGAPEATGAPTAWALLRGKGPCTNPAVRWLEDERWRFGFGLALRADPDAWAERLGATWYLDWGVTKRDPRQRPVHWQMIRVSESGFTPSLAEIQEVAGRYPGAVWIVGNEPDVIWQDNTSPERYAEHLHTLYYGIKEADPTARIAAGSIATVTPLRLAYLDRVLAAYGARYGEPMPADLWSIHLYVLREERDAWGVGIPPGIDVSRGELWEVDDHDRLDLIEAQILAFRSWMAARGYRERPLAVTEYGILMPEAYGFPPKRVQAFMLSTFDLFLTLRDESLGLADDSHRLVQQWAWFSLAYDEYPTGNLADLANGTLTSLGEAYRACVARVDGGRS